jgi:hypothetical protein
MSALIRRLANAAATAWAVVVTLAYTVPLAYALHLGLLSVAAAYGRWAGIAVAIALLAIVAAVVARWTAQRPQPVRSDETEVQ